MSEGPFICYKELLSPTNIEKSAFFHCYNKVLQQSEEYLCVLSISTISLYKVIDGSSACSNKLLSLKFHEKLFGKPNDIAILKDTNQQSDILIITLDISKIVVLRFNSLNNTFETLLLHNADENSFGIGSDLHLYSNGMRRFLGTGNECYVQTCQENALVCSVIYGSYLMFISLANFLSIEKDNNQISSEYSLNINDPDSTKNYFAIHITTSLNLPGPILDICFLSGFSRPSLAVLQQSGMLPIGHSAKIRHTCTLTVLAIDTTLKNASILWQQSDLPSDSISLLQLSNPIYNGSIIVISLNAVLIVNQNEIQGIAMNGFASTTVNLNKIGLQSWISCSSTSSNSSTNDSGGLELDASRWMDDDSVCSIDRRDVARQSNNRSSSIIGVLKDGKMLSINIALGVDEQILSSVRFKAEVIARSSKLVTTLSRSLDGSIWFLGCRQTASLLIHVERTLLINEEGLDNMKTKYSCNSSFLSTTSKRMRRRQINNEELGSHSKIENSLSENEISQLITSEECELYEHSVLHMIESSNIKNSSRNLIKYQINITDSIPTLGPILHGIYTSSDSIFNSVDSLNWERSAHAGSTHTSAVTGVHAHTSASFILDREAKDGLLLSSGLDEGGALLRIYQGLHVDKLALRTLIGATYVFSIPTLNKCDRRYSILLIAYETKTRVLHCQTEADVSSSSSSTSKLSERPELQVKELQPTESGFICTGSTLNVGILQENSSSFAVIAQITPQGIRILRLSTDYGQTAEAIQDVLLSDSLEVGGLGGNLGETVIFGDVCMGYVALLTSFQNLFVLYYNANDDCMEIIIKKSVTTNMEVNDLPISISTLSALLSSTMVSVSLYYGILDIIEPCDSVPTDEAYEIPILSKDNKEMDDKLKQQEELFLYGKLLSDIKSDDSNLELDVVMEYQTTSESKQSEHYCSSPEAYMIVTELNSCLSIIRIKDQSCIFKSNEFAKLTSFISPDLYNSTTLHSEDNNNNNNNNNNNTATHNDQTESESLNEGLIVETKCARISELDVINNDNINHIYGSICITLLLHTGELVVYSSCESNGKVYGFQKNDQYPVINKRANETKLYRSVSNDSSYNNNVDKNNVTDFSSYIISNEYLKRYGPIFNYSEEFSGRSCILVGGNEPLIVTSTHGLLSILPIGFPEVPCINYGHNSVVSFSINDVKAIATLWFEWEDIHTIKSPPVLATLPTTTTRSTKEAFLGIYQQIPSLELFPGSSLSMKRVLVGKTIHKIAEILNKTGDRTQQALLEKKTMVLACSEESIQPFIPNVLTPEEIEQDGELYERYFTNLESFSQPDLSYGKAPLIIERKHSLTLLQLGAVVDTYWLPKNESVVDMEVLYFNLEKSTTIPGMLVPLKTLEQRVFLSVCTSVIDKRGEDTIGDGRLLLFGIDYAMFEEEDDVAATVVVVDSTKDEEHDKDNDIIATTASTTTISKSEIHDLDSEKLKNKQNKFLGSIKPKLKLLWNGPGPGSVVKQLGEFVLSTVGSTVYIYKFNHDTVELEQVTFFYAQLYITSVSIIKNYVILADMHHSIQLLVWRSEDMTLTFISKDYDHTVIPHTSYLIDGSKLGIIITDDEFNLQVFQQNAKKLESIKGSRLLCIADIHLGSEVTSLLNHDLLSTENVKKQVVVVDHRPPPPPSQRTRKGSTFQLQKFGTRLNKVSVPKKTTTLITTIDGSLGLLLPMEERMYKRLVLLQQIMTMTISSLFSLNPREYRLFKSANIRIIKKKNILDGCILWRFHSLPPSIQDQLAATVGATAYLIKENLHEIDYLTRYF